MAYLLQARLELRAYRCRHRYIVHSPTGQHSVTRTSTGYGTQLVRKHPSRACVPCITSGFFIGLWLDRGDGDDKLLPGGFDAFYTYFASEQVSYGSNPDNWEAMMK